MVFMCLQYKSFEKTVGKGEIACNKQYLHFPQCFLPYHRNGAVLNSSSQWQLKGFWKLNNPSNELFIFKILLIAIDWNF